MDAAGVVPWGVVVVEVVSEERRLIVKSRGVRRTVDFPLDCVRVFDVQVCFEGQVLVAAGDECGATTVAAYDTEDSSTHLCATTGVWGFHTSKPVVAVSLSLDTLMLVDLATGHELARMALPRELEISVLRPADDRLYLWSYAGGVWTIELSESRWELCIKGDWRSDIRAAVASPDGRVIAWTLEDEAQPGLWVAEQAPGGTWVVSLVGERLHCDWSRLAIAPNGRWLVTSLATSGQDLVLVDVARRSARALGVRGPAAFDPDSTRLVSLAREWELI